MGVNSFIALAYIVSFFVVFGTILFLYQQRKKLVEYLKEFGDKNWQ